jgi:hypothetical protein
MARAIYYYRLCEAEKLKQTYSSWINKEAHIGAGEIGILKKIHIKAKRTSKAVTTAENLFTVKFEFENSLKLDAFIFLKNNGLTITDSTPKPRDPLAKSTNDVNM